MDYFYQVIQSTLLLESCGRLIHIVDPRQHNIEFHVLWAQDFLVLLFQQIHIVDRIKLLKGVCVCRVCVCFKDPMLPSLITYMRP